MTKWKKFKAWFLIFLAYLSNFGIAFASAYHYLAKDVVKNTSSGGAFFLIVTSVIFIILMVSLTKLVNKMKANLFKTIFKGLIRISSVLMLLLFTNYISVNFEALSNVLSLTIFGMVMGIVFEAIAVSKYNEYIREVGVL